MGSFRFDRFGIGVLLGIAGALAGFYIFALVWSFQNNTTVSYFISEIFLGTNFFQDKIVTISMLFDVILFALFLKLRMYNICKGLIAVLLLSVPIVIYLY